MALGKRVTACSELVTLCIKVALLLFLLSSYISSPWIVLHRVLCRVCGYVVGDKAIQIKSFQSYSSVHTKYIEILLVTISCFVLCLEAVLLYFYLWSWRTFKFNTELEFYALKTEKVLTSEAELYCGSTLTLSVTNWE